MLEPNMYMYLWDKGTLLDCTCISTGASLLYGIFGSSKDDFLGLNEFKYCVR